MDHKYNFEPIRPFHDDEVPEAIQSIVYDDFFPLVMNYLQPGADIEAVRQQFLQFRTVKEFQEGIMLKSINAIIDKTSDGLTSEGFDRINDSVNRIFLANHRDIMLDAALLDVLLHRNGLNTCQITFGSNLMKGNMVINIGKLNKMFRIIRGGNVRDFYKNSLEVSAYMRHVLSEVGESVWIAQRNGRTKDGLDKTELGVLKMLSLSSEKDFVENLDELHITPISISYEYEPCDFLKTAELYISRQLRYEKGENEDLNSILTGIRQHKGRIHLAVTRPISREELETCDKADKKEKFERLGNIIDHRIYEKRQFYPTNYIAYDLLNASTQYADHYTNAEKDAFIDYMNKGLDNLHLVGDRQTIEQIFLSIYANIFVKPD